MSWQECKTRLHTLAPHLNCLRRQDAIPHGALIPIIEAQVIIHNLRALFSVGISVSERDLGHLSTHVMLSGEAPFLPPSSPQLIDSARSRITPHSSLCIITINFLL